jgi:hypothetical protein
MKNAELTIEELRAMLLTGATELALRWVHDHENADAVRGHLAAGAGLELLVQLMPEPAMGLRLVDSDGSYVALASFKP